MNIKRTTGTANNDMAFTSAWKRRHKLASSGFTLIELMAVMVIIALLFGMIIGIAIYAKRKATEGKAQADIQHFHFAATEYKMMYGKTPPGEPQPGRSIDDTFDALAQWLPPTVDKTDPWGRSYIYKRLSDDTFDFYSTGYDDAIVGDDLRSGQ